VPLIILEITDPVDGKGSVKLGKEDMSDLPILEDLYLVVYENSPIWDTAIPISDDEWPVSSPGPLYKVCNYLEALQPGSQCDKVTIPSNPITNQPGCYALAIVSGSQADYETHDIFGVPGSSCDGTDADFGGGKATRLPGYIKGQDPWVPTEWEVIPGANDPDDSPRVPLIILEITDPVDGKGSVKLGKEDMSDLPILEDLYLVVYENSPIWDTAIPISDDEWPVSSPGPLYKVCNYLEALQPGSQCDKVTIPSNPITNLPGCYALAIVSGSQADYEVHDIFGVPGSPCEGTDADFGGGKATRYPQFIKGQDPWVPAEWEVIPGAGGDGLILYITEIADPADNPLNRYVELYSPNKRNYPITTSDNIILVRYTGANSAPDNFPYLNLASYVINEYGFLVLCVSNACYGAKCDYVLGENSIANNPGDVDVALMAGPYPGENNVIYDIYGVPGQEVYPSQDFTGGRAVRRKDAISPNSVCVADNWYVVPGGVYGGPTLSCSQLDPGCWYGIGDCDDLSAPAPSPNGKGKGGKGKGKSKGNRRTRRRLRA